MAMNSGVGIKANTNYDKKSGMIDNITDSGWLKNTFIITDEDASNSSGSWGAWIRRNRYASTADFKFTCSAPGMGVSVNTKPQFTRYADIRSKGRLLNRPEITVGTKGYGYGLGMGKYYSMAIDDPQQRIYLTFGTPQHMNTIAWLIKSFDVHRAVLANRGIITSTILNAVDVVSKGFMLIAFPYLTFTLGAGYVLLNAIASPDRYTSVKDGMFNYWCIVENILNKITVKRTMAPTFMAEYKSRTDGRMGQELNVTHTFIQELNKLIPDIIEEDTGRISVLTLALRAQIAFNRMMKEDLNRVANYNPATDYTGYPITGEESHDTYFTNKEGKPTVFASFFDRAANLLMSNVSDNIEELRDADTNPAYLDQYGNPINVLGDPEVDPDVAAAEAVDNNIRNNSETFNKLGDYILGGFAEGLTFAVFDVESTGSVGESFSTGTRDNPIESVFNALSSKSRNITNNLNIAKDIPILSDAVSLLGDAGSIMMSNVTFGLVNPVLALAYGAEIKLPKQLDSSTISLPTASYSMKLISPYGNPYSQLFNIYLPLSMLLAGALPRSTGLDSSVAPFLCQCFDRGRLNISLGAITSLNVTRGTSNLPFSVKGTPNAIDIDLTITDLHEALSVDTVGATLPSRVMGALSPNFGDSPMDKYINTLVGMDVYQQFYRWPRIRLKLAERHASLRTLGDASYWGSMMTDIIGVSGMGKAILGNSARANMDILTR